MARKLLALLLIATLTISLVPVIASASSPDPITFTVFIGDPYDQPNSNNKILKKIKDELGILELDAGRYVPTCSGVIPRRVLERIEKEDGTSGGALISNFAGPPFGYTPE